MRIENDPSLAVHSYHSYQKQNLVGKEVTAAYLLLSSKSKTGEKRGT